MYNNKNFNLFILILILLFSCKTSDKSSNDEGTNYNDSYELIINDDLDNISYQFKILIKFKHNTKNIQNFIIENKEAIINEIKLYVSDKGIKHMTDENSNFEDFESELTEILKNKFFKNKIFTITIPEYTIM